GNIANNHCYPPIAYETRVLSLEVEGAVREILAVVVPASQKKPHFAGVAYVRQVSQSINASAEVFQELVASQNDKARRILDHKNDPMFLRLKSESGFWYSVDGRVEFCDAHTIRIAQNDGWVLSFPLAEIVIHEDLTRKLVVTAKPPWTEEEHLLKMVRHWR